MSKENANQEKGFSLIELLTAMVISLIILGATVAVFSGALSTRTRESSRTDAITSAQAALNIMSREIGNAGYGLTLSNGLVYGDCDTDKLRFRANIQNTGTSGAETSQDGEDVTYFYDSTTHSVLRFDKNASETSGIINRVSDVNFTYYNYTFDPVTKVVTVTQGAAATNTGRVRIELLVTLPDVQGQPSGRVEKVWSDVTLRNSPYMLGQY